MKLYLELIFFYFLRAILTDFIFGRGLVRTIKVVGESKKFSVYMIQNTSVRVIILMENLFLYKTTMFFNIVITMQLIAPGYPVSMGLIFFVALVFPFKDP